MAAIEVPSHMRTVPGSINIPVAQFSVLPDPKSTTPDPYAIATSFIKTFNDSLARQDFKALSEHFVETGFWRDHLALSWEFHTAHTPKNIHIFLQHVATSKNGFRLRGIALDESSEARKPQMNRMEGYESAITCVQFMFEVDTVIGRGLGLAKMVEERGVWKLYTLYTSMREIKGHEETTYANRPKGVEHGGKPGRKNWAERRAAEANFEDGSEPAVFVLGKFNPLIQILQAVH